MADVRRITALEKNAATYELSGLLFDINFKKGFIYHLICHTEK